MDDKYLDRAGAATYLSEKGLKITKGTLQKYATVGGGPEYQHFGNRVVYKPPKLDVWADQKLATPRRPRKSRKSTEAASATER